MLERWVFDTAACVAETSDRTVVGPTLELLLHGLRKHGTFNIRVGGRLGCEFAVEVGSVSLVDLLRTLANTL
jgi:hypothetical protein